MSIYNQGSNNNKNQLTKIISKTNSNCSVFVNKQEIKKKEATLENQNETLKILDSCVGTKNFDELIKINADTLVRKQNKPHEIDKLFEKLPIKERVRLMVRVYKDMANNLNFAFDKKKLEETLLEKDNSFWNNFRGKRVKSQQVKNMEYNNILKAEKVEILELQIAKKKEEIKERQEEKFAEYMKLAEDHQKLEKGLELQAKRIGILRKNQQNVKREILNDFFGINFLVNNFLFS